MSIDTNSGSIRPIIRRLFVRRVLFRLLFPATDLCPPLLCFFCLVEVWGREQNGPLLPDRSSGKLESQMDRKVDFAAAHNVPSNLQACVHLKRSSRQRNVQPPVHLDTNLLVQKRPIVCGCSDWPPEKRPFHGSNFRPRRSTFAPPLDHELNGSVRLIWKSSGSLWPTLGQWRTFGEKDRLK